jgi:pilus assembly protein CpaF
VDQDGKIMGKLVPTGIRPKFYETLTTSGITIPTSVFLEEEDWNL